MNHDFDIHALDRELRAAGFQTDMIFSVDEHWWMGVKSFDGSMLSNAIEVSENGHVEITMILPESPSQDWDALRIVDRHVNGFPPLHPLSNIAKQIESQEWGTIRRFLSNISLPENVEQALASLEGRVTE